MAVESTGRMAGKVLVVDDEREIRDLVRTVLSGEGFEVDARPAADMLLSRIPAIRPDVIVLDVHMPVEGGGSFLRRLRCVEQFSSIPVVMMSGKPVTLEERDAYRELGAVDFLQKPFDVCDLVGRIRRLVQPAAADV